MASLLIIIHLSVCLFLIGVVLIQGGKGAQLGSAFGGGSSQTLFGGRGAATFMNKLTTGVAISFMITSLVLTVVSAKRGTIVRQDSVPEEKALPVPPLGVTPETLPSAPSEAAPGEEPAKKE
jgi:preprotein translocase subunit SecG